MKKPKIVDAIANIDDDIIDEALSDERPSKAVKKNTFRRMALIAAALACLAVAVLTGFLIASLPDDDDQVPIVNLTPPADAIVIRGESALVQISTGTLHSYNSYPDMSNSYALYDELGYSLINGVEIDGGLYNDMLNSRDGDKVWQIRIDISPNIYRTEEFITAIIERDMTEVEKRQLEQIREQFELLRVKIGTDKLYDAIGAVIGVEILEKIVARDELSDLVLNTKLGNIENKLSELEDKLDALKDSAWVARIDALRAALKAQGIEYIEADDGALVIFVTEGRLISLEGVEGFVFSKAHGVDITVGRVDSTVMTEWNGLQITENLRIAIDANDYSEALLATRVFIDGGLDREELEALRSEYTLLITINKIMNSEWKDALELAQSGDPEKVEKVFELMGEQLYERYIKDGKFDEKLFDRDMEELLEQIDEISKNIIGRSVAEVYSVFLPQVRFIEVTDSGDVVIYVTEEELAGLTFEDEYAFALY